MTRVTSNMVISYNKVLIFKRQKMHLRVASAGPVRMAQGGESSFFTVILFWPKAKSHARFQESINEGRVVYSVLDS